MIYYISDLHFGHSNIIKLCNRPFQTLEEMNNALINNWNSKVTNGDKVYIIGDLFFRSQNNPEEILSKLFFNRSSLNISTATFNLVPLQDFTEKSDIDWSKPIPEIDKQLYKKYNLSQEEIDFIETKVKPME